MPWCEGLGLALGCGPGVIAREGRDGVHLEGAQMRSIWSAGSEATGAPPEKGAPSRPDRT